MKWLLGALRSSFETCFDVGGLKWLLESLRSSCECCPEVGGLKWLLGALGRSRESCFEVFFLSSLLCFFLCRLFRSSFLSLFLSSFHLHLDVVRLHRQLLLKVDVLSVLCKVRFSDFWILLKC